MKQKPFCSQCCRTLISPGATARPFFVLALEIMTCRDPPPSPPFAQASLFISACAGRASQDPFKALPRQHWWFGDVSGWRAEGFIIGRCAKWMGSVSQTPNWEIFAPAHAAGVGPKHGMNKTIAPVVDVHIWRWWVCVFPCTTKAKEEPSKNDFFLSFKFNSRRVLPQKSFTTEGFVQIICDLALRNC